MTRHLLPAAAAAALARGKAIEQLLSVEPGEPFGRVIWLTVSLTRDGRAVVSRHDVRDVGGPSLKDVASFPPTDENEYTGEGSLLGNYEDGDTAMRAAEAHGASASRWVNEGLIDAEYSDAHGYR